MLTLTTEQINLWLALLVYPLFRILGIFAADPFYSSRLIPARVKIVLALLLAMLVAPAVGVGMPPPVVSPSGILLAGQQILIGVVIGFVMRVVFTTVEMAGHLSGLQMGLGFATFYDPQHSANVPVLAQMLSLLTLLVFLAFNGHLMVIETLIRSFLVLPVSAGLPSVKGFQDLVRWSGIIFSTGVWLAMPVIVAMLVANLSIGIMTRASPQFNIFAVGFPLTLGVGFVALYLLLPFLVPHILHLVEQSQVTVDAILKAFSGR